VTPRFLARSLAVSLGAATLAAGARADTTLSGVCPDGSFFVVQSRESVPCANPRFADPSDLPPVRPYLLPRPYTWYVDQEARSANNPYNVLDTAQKIRAARAGAAEATAQPPVSARQAAGGAPTQARGVAPEAAQATRAPAAAPLVSLADEDLRDLVRLIALRQEAAPATLDLEDVHGRRALKIEIAYSSSFESYALQTLSREPAANRVLVWSAQAQRDTDFHPNFFVVQNGRTFRPDPQKPGDAGFLLGAPGALPGGEMAVGYLVIPASFDPRAPLEVFWNDRSVEAVLNPPAN
jgi:hypothetical protein